MQQLSETDRNWTALQELMRLSVEETVCIVGSGPSLTGGAYPTWPHLIQRLCKACRINIDSYDLENSIEDLLQAADECQKADHDAYLLTLQSEIGAQTTIPLVYKRLAELPFCGFLTVNFDHCLAEELSSTGRLGCLHVYPHLPPFQVQSQGLYHVHGLVERDQCTKLVLSASDFLEAYDPSTGACTLFLKQVLAHFDCLYIGWSMREPPMKALLEQVRRMRENLERDGGRRVKHLMLMAVSDGDVSDENLSDRAREGREEQRFRELGFDVLKYDKEDESHFGLQRLIESWARHSPYHVSQGPFDRVKV